MRVIAVIFASLVAAQALAVPLQLTHQGRLLDIGGQPLDGMAWVDFSLWDSELATTELWVETHPVDFDDGFFNVTLGGTNPIDESILDAPELWFSLTMGGEELLPRQIVVSAPYAVMASTAENVIGGVVDASSIAIDGTTVIDESGTWLGATMTDTLSGLSCANGDVALFDAGSWGCVASASFDTQLSTSDVEQIVADAGFATSSDMAGFVTDAELAAALADVVADSDLATALADYCTRTELTTTLAAYATNAELAAAIPTSADGTTLSTAGLSCRTLLQNGQTSDGTYWLDPDGDGGTAAYQAYCDMTTLGGGWTLVHAKVSSNFMPWSASFVAACANTQNNDCASAIDSHLRWDTAMWRFVSTNTAQTTWNRYAHQGLASYLQGSSTTGDTPNLGFAIYRNGVLASTGTSVPFMFFTSGYVTENHGGSDTVLNLWTSVDPSNDYIDDEGDASLQGRKCIAGYCKAEAVWLMVR